MIPTASTTVVKVRIDKFSRAFCIHPPTVFSHKENTIMFAVRQTITSLARASVRGPLVNAAVFANLPASPAGIATRLGAVNWSQSSSYVTKKPRQRLQMQSQPQRRVAIQRKPVINPLSIRTSVS